MSALERFNNEARLRETLPGFLDQIGPCELADRLRSVLREPRGANSSYRMRRADYSIAVLGWAKSNLAPMDDFSPRGVIGVRGKEAYDLFNDEVGHAFKQGIRLFYRALESQYPVVKIDFAGNRGAGVTYITGYELRRVS